MKSDIHLQEIGNKIHFIRGHRVMLDRDLASLYQVDTKALNQAVKRNLERFPPDFMFQLVQAEVDLLRSQSVTLEIGRGRHSKYLPYVFTEQGVAMLSSVLRSSRAVQVNIEIMRTFVKLRELMESNRDLAKKLNRLEQNYDEQFRAVFQAIRQLMGLGVPAQRRIKGLDRE